ncbi:hypothetical protein GLE_3462 [Lysobacter enzymogenes]|uniref:Uncharacterized protein n=1 Tax=Lysobacter enzymogenes TaxID=69 RepID=A0A0S2DJJ3_LYSEN|nr:hypothetical protein GLE_3462 [Lysobacter enzymogenes]
MSRHWHWCLRVCGYDDRSTRNRSAASTHRQRQHRCRDLLP